MLPNGIELFVGDLPASFYSDIYRSKPRRNASAAYSASLCGHRWYFSSTGYDKPAQPAMVKMRRRQFAYHSALLYRRIRASKLAKADVNTPAAAIAHDDTADCISECRIRLAVPIPCEEVPIAAPIARSFLTPTNLSRDGPNVAPRTPVRMTIAIVICGSP